MKKSKNYYFSTRDLMMMAALAAVGGVAGTYINFIGDFFQSILGFAGTTQWASGLHVIWIMLAAAIVRKPGTATATGILKGFVEFLSGNTHGLLVLIVNVLAGLIVDLVLLPNRDKQPGWLFYMAAGLSSASNIFVFQFFASIPEDILTLVAILLTSGLSFLSGVFFGGFIAKSLLNSLYKAGILNEPEYYPANKNLLWPITILIIAFAITLGTGVVYLNQTSIESGVQVTGNVANPFAFPGNVPTFNVIEISVNTNGVNRSFTGASIKKLIDFSKPINADWILQVSATDGYSFFISQDEVDSNPDLIITTQEVGGRMLYNIVGAYSSKAWVRGVNNIKVIGSGQFEINGRIDNPFVFQPEVWTDQMDSTYLNLDGDMVKMQGVALRSLWILAEPLQAADSMEIKGIEANLDFPISGFIDSDEIRIFTWLGPDGMEFVLGRMNGEVLLKGIQSIEIK